MTVPLIAAPGIADVWSVWLRHASAIEDRVFSGARQPQKLEEVATRSQWSKAIDAAIRGDLPPLEEFLRRHGAGCLERGHDLEQCGALLGAVERELVSLIVAELSRDSVRLTGALLALRDFTERCVAIVTRTYLERKEAELHAREEDLATTLDSIGDGVVVTDASGCVVRMNPVAERLTGFPIAEARGRRLVDIFQIEREDTGEPVENPAVRVLREGTVVGLANHTVLVARDGVRRPIADSGAPVRDKRGTVRGVVLVFRDVSEEREAEEKLRHWERVFQHANWGVALADVKEVKFRAVNPAYAAMHGYTVEELLGAPVSTLWTSETKEDMERHAHETHEHGHLVTETTHRRKDGSTLPVEVVAATIRDAGGKLAWFVANVQDITERRRLQRSRVKAMELEARNQRIEEANRMKSEFLANMSHELRTPLNSVIGFAELLHDEHVGPVLPRQKEFLGDILTGGRHLLRLINDVLDLAKVEAGKMEFRPEPVNVERLVATVVQSLRAMAIEKQLEVTVAVDPSLSDIEIDPGRFKQVLYNYLSNALKFTPDGGHIAVNVSPEGDGKFRLEVEDSGPGIPEQQVPSLFIAFQQLEGGSAKRHGGTGLGLALTRRLAEAQGGTVGVRAAPSRGSVFFVILPRRQAVRPEPALRRIDKSSGTRLLVVVPEEHLRFRILEAVLDAGYEAETASSFSDGLQLWQRQHSDCVVLGVGLGEAPAEVERMVQQIRGEGRERAVPVIGVGSPNAQLSAWLSDVVANPLSTEGVLAALERVGVPAPGGRPVLVVDDDVSSLKLMEATLSNLGYESACFADPHAALLALPRLRPCAVVIDIIMPELDGIAFVRRFRADETNRNVPVMFWTVKDLSADERRSLQGVADVVVQKGVGDGSRLASALANFLPGRRQAEGGPS